MVTVVLVVAVSCPVVEADAREKGIRAHVDEEHGFVIGYSSEYTLNRLGASGDLYVEGLGGVRLLTVQVCELAGYPREEYNRSRDVFLDFAADRAILRCGADGPDGSAYCSRIYSISHYENSKGLRILKMYLEHVQVVYGDPPESTATVVGPVYMADISRPEYTAVLMIGSVPYERLSDLQIGLAERLAASLDLLPDSRFQGPSTGRSHTDERLDVPPVGK
jgi:hypothetical protein